MKNMPNMRAKCTAANWRLGATAALTPQKRLSVNDRFVKK